MEDINQAAVDRMADEQLKMVADESASCQLAFNLLMTRPDFSEPLRSIEAACKFAHLLTHPILSGDSRQAIEAACTIADQAGEQQVGDMEMLYWIFKAGFFTGATHSMQMTIEVVKQLPGRNP